MTLTELKLQVSSSLDLKNKQSYSLGIINLCRYSGELAEELGRGLKNNRLVVNPTILNSISKILSRMLVEMVRLCAATGLDMDEVAKEALYYAKARRISESAGEDLSVRDYVKEL